MNKGFWSKLQTPIMALAPLYDVTDAAFRQIIAKYGKFTRPDGTPGGGPDIFYTEFVSAEGLNSIGRERLLNHLWFEPGQHPIVAQIFGKDPGAFFAVGKLVKNLGFDGVDINLGCPDKNIMKQGSCAALFHNPKLVQELIAQAKAGSVDLPVSVKIRIGDTKIDWKAWISSLLEAKPAAIAIHLRTRKEMSKVPAHWEEMSKIMKFVIDQGGNQRPLILGNGDVKNISEAKQRATESGCDGVMIGRGIFGNPWLFSEKNPSVKEKLSVMVEHTELFDKLFKGMKSFEIMKKHYKAYANGFDGSKELRAQLMDTKSVGEVKQIVENFIS